MPAWLARALAWIMPEVLRRVVEAIKARLAERRARKEAAAEIPIGGTDDA